MGHEVGVCGRRSIDAVEAEVAEVCGVLNAAHARLVGLVAEALDGELWAQAGIRSPEHWLAWKSGFSPRRSGEVVAIARRHRELPRTMATFAEGRLAVDQVAPIARHAPTHTDAEVCQFATQTTVAQLRRTLSTYSFATPLDPAPADADGDAATRAPRREPAGRERVAFGFGDDGRFWLHADLLADRGAIVETALREARDRLFTAGQRDVTWPDAFDDLCQRNLDRLPVERRARFTPLVHLHVERLDAAHLDTVALPDGLRRYLTCDGAVTPVWERDATPYAVGRSQRIVPLRTRRLVAARDRGCRFPGCTNTIAPQMHHIQHWEDRFPSDPDNIVQLCAPHHRAHHLGHFDISGDPQQPDGLTFTHANGAVIPAGPRPQPPPADAPLPAPLMPYRHPLGERLQHKWVHFNEPPEPRARPPAS
jgi:hypothetical protein